MLVIAIERLVQPCHAAQLVLLRNLDTSATCLIPSVEVFAFADDFITCRIDPE